MGDNLVSFFGCLGGGVFRGLCLGLLLCDLFVWWSF